MITLGIITNMSCICSYHQRPSVPASPTSQSALAAASRSAAGMGSEPQKGVVTVLDIMRVRRPEGEEVNVADKIDGVIAHFIAHNKVRLITCRLL